MAEFPALTLWTDSYLGDTRHLSTLEHGAYLLLLMEAWRRPKCNLPDDDTILARLAGLTVPEWQKIKPVVMDLWRFDGRSKTWSQKRLSLERDKARKRSKSAKDSASKRWNKKKKPDANAMRMQCETDASTATDIEEPKGSSPPTPSRGNAKRLIPEDWKPPSPSDLSPQAKACAEQWPRTTYDRQAEAFVNYWLGERKMKADWNRAWANRVVDIHDRVMRSQSFGNGSYQQSGGEQLSMTEQILRQQRETTP